MTIPTAEEQLLYEEYHKYNRRGQPAILCKELVKRNCGRIKVLALDLERTLVNDFECRWPRRGLFSFLEAVKELFPRVVIFTAVQEQDFREVAIHLVAEKKAPPWFADADIEYVEWPRKGKKNLAYIPGIEPHEALLVDDHFGYVHSQDLFQYISIRAFEGINYHHDFEFARVFGVLEMIMLNEVRKETVLAYLEPKVNQSGSGIKRAWLYGPIAKGEADSESTIQIAIEINGKEDAERLSKPFGRSIFKDTQDNFQRYFWAKTELILYPGNDSELKKKIDDEAIIIINQWENFYAVFLRADTGIDILFPDLPGCQGVCLNDNSDHFDRVTIQAIGPAGDILDAWMVNADQKDVPVKRLTKKELKGRYPGSRLHETSVRLPWK